MDRVGTILRDLEGGRPLQRRLAQAQAIESWPELVGPHLAERTRALRVSDGRLIVLAPGASLRQELSFHRRTVLERFNRRAGARLAREVVFVETDSLGGHEDAAARARPVAPRRDAVEHEEARGIAADGETTEAEVPDQPAMVEPFDAAAYRRRLERIAEAQPQEKE